MNKVLKNIGLITLSILLLTLAWPPFKFGYLAYIGFVPMFLFFDNLVNLPSLKKYLASFSGLMIVLFLFPYISSYNGWGEYNDNIFMVILMCFLPTSLIVSLFVLFKNKKLGYLFFVLAWGTMEILQMNWELNSPLLMFGNTLSYYPSLIQHYSIWGVVGGSMYILTINILIFFLLKNYFSNNISLKTISPLIIVFLITIISVFKYHQPLQSSKKINVGIALLHINPFSDWYYKNPFMPISMYNKLLKNKKHKNIQAYFFPESTIINGGWIENLNNKNLNNPIDKLFPNKDIILGTHLFSIYKDNVSPKPYYVYYDSFSKTNYLKHNGIVFRSSLNTYYVKTKNKFVPFHETKPYVSILGELSNLFSKEKNALFLSEYKYSFNKPFTLNNGVKVQCVMCFESFFSNVMCQELESDFTAVLANESWNYQDKGKEQYFTFMIPKAIESGKSILKIANGGYSGLINSKGTILKKIDYNKPGLFEFNVDLKSDDTFYSKFFKQISFIISFTTFLLLIYLIFKNLTKNTS